MTRATWRDIAFALAGLREQLLDHSRRGGRAAHLERIVGVELAARAICHVLRAHSSRFDGRRFMQIISSPTK